MRSLAVAALLAVLLALAGASADAAGDSFRLIVAGRGFDDPVLVTFAPGEPKTLYASSSRGGS